MAVVAIAAGGLRLAHSQPLGLVELKGAEGVVGPAGIPGLAGPGGPRGPRGPRGPEGFSFSYDEIQEAVIVSQKFQRGERAIGVPIESFKKMYLDGSVHDCFAPLTESEIVRYG